jgi:hypothetical protein|nr:MAG TPA: hypothetical protein [Caudoviricetes sp.]
MSFEEFMNIGITEFNRKLSSIPKSEPLYEIIQSRKINTSTIKDKEERKHWRNLKKANKIPQLYLSISEIDNILKEELKNGTKKI